jgi:putative glutamine amidotransferase
MSEKDSEIKIGLSHSFSMGSLMKYYPDIKIIKNKTEVNNYDLIIFPGGEDINPNLYGEDNIYSDYNEKRDIWEYGILDSALEYGKKIFGICRGLQLINCFLCGNLWQDILFQLKENHPSSHELKFENKTILSDYFFIVNSMHHQAVRFLGKGLRVTSTRGKIVESLEGRNIICVQFHPEFMAPKISKPFFDYLKVWTSKEEKPRNKKEEQIEWLKSNYIDSSVLPNIRAADTWNTIANDNNLFHRDVTNEDEPPV